MLQLNKIMKEQGRTNKWLAEKVGVTPHTIGNYRKHTTTPPYDVADRICTALGVEWGELIGREAEREGER